MVVFAVVVNRSAGVTGLTADELRKIYTGNGTNRNQRGGKDRSYPFWEVEHAYTYRGPEPKLLTAAFLDYIRSTQARPVLERGGLVPCGALPPGFCD